ncbi:MAG: glycosyltransferase family 2 protein [Candidatus Dadabacteria bacterium]
MVIIEIIFWLSLILLVYTYFGYAIILWLISKLQKHKDNSVHDFYPAVTLIVPVYNEEGFIERKIQNCLALNYPPGKLSLFFVNDGSTDSTAEIIKKYSSIQLLDKDHRMGKSAALNSAMQLVKTEYVVFSDANTILDVNSLQMLMQQYGDEKVGGVSGEKKIKASNRRSLVSNAEQLYWEYESMLKRVDSAFHTIVGADGGLFSIRTHLFEPLDETTILDDFFISAAVCLKGYLVKYEPRAFVIETSSVTLKEEKKRKVRISAGCFQALVRLKALLNPFKHTRVFLIYLSHRVLRWVACPLFLILLFISNLLLSLYSTVSIYDYLLILQVTFYLTAVAGYFLSSRIFQFRALLVPYYFVFMNYTIYLGFGRFAHHNQSVLWEKAHRA